MVPGPAEVSEKPGFPVSWYQTLLQSPNLTLSLLFSAIFLASFVVMNILHRIPSIPEELDIVADSLLLVFFLYPCLVFLLKRPYLHQIKERKRTEVALSQSESRLRMILDSNPYFMAVRDAGGVILMASKVFADFYGTSTERMIGTPQAELHKAAGLNASDLQRSLEADREVIESGEARFGLEHMADGEGVVHWYRTARLPVSMPSGARCVLMTSAEVTRRILSEDAQRKTNWQLQRRVEDHTAELAKTNRELREAVEAYRSTAEELSVSRSQLRDLSESLRSALEEERTRISRELHDELGQSLTALKFDLEATKNPKPADEISLTIKADEMIRLVDSILTTVKRVSRDLRPGMLDDLGLAAAIEWQAKEFRKRTGIPCEVFVDPEDLSVDPDRSTAIFRIFQEALTNVARHAGATKVESALECRDGALSLEVRDNGRGITEEEISGAKSLGIIGIRERVRYMGGEVRIEGSPGAGTVVTVSIPAGKEGRPDAPHPHRG
jgi:PAS domain S-box-containing protein